MSLGNVPNFRGAFKSNSDGTRELRALSKGSGSILAGLEYDEIQVTYPSNTVEEYEYLLDSVTVANITVTYQSASKKNLVSVVKT